MNATPSVFPSVMRTAVPLVAGGVITALASVGVDFGSERVTTVVTAVVTGVYYTLFRLLENAAPTGGRAEKVFGFLLGFVRPPVYPEPVKPAPTVVTSEPPRDYLG